MFTREEKKYLIGVARHALEEEIAGGSSLPVPVRPSASEHLAQKSGAFVTLMEGSELRGCLGLLSADAPLPETIAEMARRAATEDPRFDPVTAQELGRLSIELSILSPFTPIAGPSEIQIGRDGLLVTQGRRRGLLLPQVAERYHFTPEEFLEETCLKAGLPRAAWKMEETSLFSFRADVIEEEET
ncbi:MAG: AmmeMemoRadiSam system protein A [Acidobacteriota bacterium]